MRYRSFRAFRGLVINPDGSSSSVQQINGGAVTAIFARTYRVTADHPGTYTVAPIQMGNATLRPLTVQVLPAGSVARGGPMGLPPPSSPRTEHVAPEPTTPAQIAAAVRAAMPIMKVVLPKTPIYAGQLVPIQIKGYFRDGTSARTDRADDRRRRCVHRERPRQTGHPDPRIFERGDLSGADVEFGAGGAQERQLSHLDRTAAGASHRTARRQFGHGLAPAGALWHQLRQCVHG